MSYEAVVRLPVVWTCVSGQLLVHLFEGTLTIDHMKELERTADAWRMRRPGKYVELVLIFPSNAKMSLEERAYMARLIKRSESRRTASSTVILAEGITGAFQRSVLTGLQMLVPPAHPVKVFGDIGSAVTFLTPFLRSLGSHVTVDAVSSDVDAMCRDFHARAASRAG